ncbi:MAG: outer membrane protein assembly factor BamD [Alphaproteobacteria bacterium]
MILKRFSLLLCFLAIFNCSSNSNKDGKTLTNNQETSDLMYLDAMNKFNSNQLDEAIIIFEEIERLYPLSNEAIQSQIMSGFIDYINLEYDNAIYKFTKIINKYPSLKNIDYVYYMKALCYYEQISHEGLDGKNNFLALENLQQLIIRFPSSKYSKDARQKIVLVNSNIAAKHMNIGKFYQKKAKYTAALSRYKIVIDNFSNTKFTSEALYRTTEIYMTLGLKEEASNTASVLGYNYPKSKWYELSYNLINKNKSKSFLEKLNFLNNE